MLTKPLCCIILYVSCFCISPFPVLANQTDTQISNEDTVSIDELLNQDKLSVSLKVNQQAQQIVGQALVLSIEVATDRWFAQGSSIERFNLANTVMQANNVQTINGSKRINGQTWATQTHEITLYPTSAGVFQVEPITLDVSINSEKSGIINGKLSTQPIEFTVDLPKALDGIENFIVSPEVTLNIEGAFDENKDYAIGEAITQTIVITASNTPAMMIPDLNITRRKDVEEDNAILNGISIYRKPAQVFDKSNRGTLLGTRIESSTYIFEQPGKYEIAERVIYWWNTQSDSLEALVIPASTWTVSSGSFASAASTRSALANLTLNSTVALVIVALLVIMLIVWLFVKYFKLIKAFYIKVTRYQQKQIKKRFFKAIIQKEYLAANQYLYQYALSTKKAKQLQHMPYAIALNKVAFAKESVSQKESSLSIGISDAKALIKQLDAVDKTKVNRAYFSSDKPIALNKSS